MVDLAESTVIFATARRARLELGWAVGKDGTETLVDGDGTETLMDGGASRGRRHRSRSFHV
jgi:hypothetical protein